MNAYHIIYLLINTKGTSHHIGKSIKITNIKYYDG